MEFDRLEIIQSYIPNANKWDHRCRVEIAELTEGLTGAELKIACKEAIAKQLLKNIDKSKGLSLHVNEPTVRH